MPVKTLFSQHYLDTRLPALVEWTEDPRAAFEAVRSLWDGTRSPRGLWSEAQTEEEFLKPLLAVLEWSFIVQPKSRHAGQVSRPDYALFADEAARQEAYPHQGHDDAFYSRALAIAEAKYWGRPLSRKEASGRDTWKSGENPSHQMVSYLVGTGAPWGILTNGLIWRLYSREVSSTASEFYEVDLGALFDFLLPGSEPTAEQWDQFRRWWLFFRRAAFLPDAQGKSFVQRIHEGSATYAREISDKLKELVFEQVMPEIAGGFVAYRYHQLGIREETDEDLRQVYQAGLGLLYKLLFLLYAEARGLLPVNEPGYAEQSLTTLAHWAAERLDRHLPLSDATHAAGRYDSLLALFHRIDQGDPSLGIPRYNGGLFAPDHPDNRFLERHKLSDRVVARAVDTLVRDASRPVDYAFISVRNLGAIYEGLLENRLRVVDAAAGRVELVNDKGERKASGSYYTPDYIVDYIVRHTLDPLLEERGALFRAAMDRCAGLQRELQHDRAGAPVLREQLAAAERDAREAFLGIKVLDPAMGSGHFLVNAVDHLTDQVIRRRQVYRDEHPDVPWEWDPIQQLIERVRGEVLAEMASQGIAMEAGRLDDTALLTRLVMKRCIYGVDLNRMAVELAKLSLWLHSFTVGAPLSFLDHHLRWGNSLVGADVRTVEKAIQVTETGQMGLFQGPFAGLLELTSLMTEIVERGDATLADVRQSAMDFERLQEALVPYKRVLDLWVSQYFGNAGARDLLTLHGGDVLPALRGESPLPAEERAVVDRAHALWQEKRFFHWDLEFPEVFVDLRRRDWAENPGFDAVVGNPPYGYRVSQEIDGFMESCQGKAQSENIAEYFVEGSFRLLARAGTWGMILPKQVLHTPTWADVRNTIGRSEGRGVQHIVDVSEAFEEVLLEQVVVTALPRHSDRIHVGYIQHGAIVDHYSIARIKTERTLWPIYAFDEFEKIFEKINSVSVPLGDIAGLFFGIKNIKAKLTQDSGFPMVIGDNIARYTFVGKFPRLPEEQLSASMRERHLLPKVVVQRIVAHVTKPSPRIIVMANFDAEGVLAFDTVTTVVKEVSDLSYHYLLAILNSRFAAWYLHRFLFNLSTRTMDFRKGFADYLPICRIAFVTPAGEREKRGEEGRGLVSGWIADKRIGPTGSAGPIEPAPGTKGLSANPLEESADQAFPHLSAWLEARLSPTHTPDPDLVRRHNADPRNRDWQLPEEGPVEQADVVHDLLAHLAEQMIALNKEKQAEVKGFLAWLERECGVPLGELAGVSRLRNYIGDYQKGEAHLALEDVLEILRKNRRKLKVDPSGRAFQERLQQEYAAGLGKLLPLKERLAGTDRLIDRIVYRLYGLTEEEVAIVEGQAASTSAETQE